MNGDVWIKWNKKEAQPVSQSAHLFSFPKFIVISQEPFRSDATERLILEHISMVIVNLSIIFLLSLQHLYVDLCYEKLTDKLLTI